MTERFIYASGLRRVAESLAGEELVYGGTLPSARWDAGARLRLLAYPVLLSRALVQRGVRPRLRLMYVVPDWAVEGPLRGTTRQYEPDDGEGERTKADAAERWLQTELTSSQGALKGVTVQVARASSLRTDAGFRAVLRLALRSPRHVADAFPGVPPGMEMTDAAPQLAGPVCRRCHSIRGRMEYIEGWDRIQFHCTVCDNSQEAEIREQDYWVHEWVLEAAVRAGLRPDVIIVSDADAQREAAVEAVLRRALKEPVAAARVLAAPGAAGLADDAPLETLLDLAREGHQRGAT